MGTPHNQAEKGQIAKTVLMPGDPLRAKFIAERYLSDVFCFNTVRNMLGFTGKYNGTDVSVMASGMGMPSIGIYSYELFNDYGVENIIRVGTAGSLQRHVKVPDVVICQGASADSAFASQYALSKTATLTAISSWELLEKSVNIAKEMGVRYHVGQVLSSDVFYNADPDYYMKWSKLGILCVEMESYALFCNAAYLGKRAMCLLTISDTVPGVTDEVVVTTPEQRQSAFTEMMEISLKLAVSA